MSADDPLRERSDTIDDPLAGMMEDPLFADPLFADTPKSKTTASPTSKKQEKDLMSALGGDMLDGFLGPPKKAAPKKPLGMPSPPPAHEKVSFADAETSVTAGGTAPISALEEAMLQAAADPLGAMGLGQQSEKPRTPLPYPTAHARTAKESVLPAKAAAARANQPSPEYTDLLDGEYVTAADHSQRLGEPSFGGGNGTLYVTNYRLLWEASNTRNMLPHHVRSIAVPFMSLMVMNERKESGGRHVWTFVKKWSAGVTLQVVLDLGVKADKLSAELHRIRAPGWAYTFPEEHAAAFKQKHAHAKLPAAELERLATVRRDKGVQEQNAAVVMETDRKMLPHIDGWKLYDIEAEAEGIGANWQVVDINDEDEKRGRKAYECCQTYPRRFIVPKGVYFGSTKVATGDEFHRGVTEVANFRSGRRMPVFCYKYNMAWMSAPSITRCSQPLIGPTGKRGYADEALLMAIKDTNIADQLVVIDCRPKMNAQANLVAGKGYERGEAYHFCDVRFLDIENIHVMRDSLNALLELLDKSYNKWGDTAETNSSHWIAQLDRCCWMEHIRMVIRAAVQSAKVVSPGGEQPGQSILVHCSDGWDRTPQITALTQILLDGEARTIRGLETLIEKEWCSFGHQIGPRTMNWYGTRPEKMDPEQFSPVFLQFIEAIHHIWCQFPEHFEFNQLFLLEILDHCTNGRSGTFLISFDKDREQQQLREKTLSVWTILNQDLDRFKNPWYVPQHRYTSSPIIPNFHVGKLKVWEAFYCRGAEVCAREDMLEKHTREVSELKESNAALKEEVARLRRERDQGS